MQQKNRFKKRGLTPIGSTVSGVLEPLWAKQDAMFVQLLQAWPTLMGSDLSQKSVPEKLTFPKQAGEVKAQNGTLALRIQSGTALEFQYQLPALIQKLNSYFGYQAVGQIVLKQGNLLQTKRPQPTIQPPKDVPISESLSPQSLTALQHVTDKPLQEALHQLGKLLV